MSQRAVLLQHVRPVPGTQEREREQDKGGREGGREKEKDERDRVESVVVGGGGKKRAKIHVDHSNSPALFHLFLHPLPLRTFSFYKALIFFLPFSNDKKNKRRRRGGKKAQRCSLVKFCPSAAAAAAAAAEQHSPLPLSTTRLTGKPCG